MYNLIEIMEKLWNFGIIVLLICIHGIDLGVARIRFRQGRGAGGNLGEPTRQSRYLNSPPVPELWFDQIFDPFNPFSNETWKQVCISLDIFNTYI